MTFVPTDIGTKLGSLVVQACQSKNLSPCKVGYLYDIKASALDVAIHGAFAKAIAADPAVKVVAEGQSFFSPTEGLTAVQNMLQANPSLNLIVGSDQGIEGGAQALQTAHHGQGHPRRLRRQRRRAGGRRLRRLVRRRRPGARERGPTGRPGADHRASHREEQRRHRPGRPAAERRRGHQGEREPVHRRVARLTLPGPSGLQGAHVELRDIGKSFGGVRALEAVSLKIGRGSIHALVGENGAGKSTLGKIIAGVIPPDDGQVLLDGEPVRFHSPREAIARGIVLIAQELSSCRR